MDPVIERLKWYSVSDSEIDVISGYWLYLEGKSKPCLGVNPGKGDYNTVESEVDNIRT